MKVIMNPRREDWSNLCVRNIPADDPEVTSSVEEIVKEVARRGDNALFDFAERFDGFRPLDLKVNEHEIDTAVKEVKPEVKKAIAKARANIRAFHEAQLHEDVDIETMPGVRCVQRSVPIRRVGLYVPGGRAPLFSTVLMLAEPAKVAGCREIVLFTPRHPVHGIAPEILYTACECGVDEIYGIGGAQAIAAMAYGTQSIAPVDKIFGPGNRYVTKAKQLVSRITSIDMPAGPSEVMVMADHTAHPSFVAGDLLSQAEHGPDSQAMLICDSPEFAKKVLEEIKRQKSTLHRADSVEGSLENSRAIVFGSRQEMIDFANTYAAEHLIISMQNPWEVADQITAAGSVFIGPYSPESAGDYASGTNHTLPTGGWARSCNGVNTDSFIRKITYQELTRDGLAGLASVIETMATAEGLDAHANAVRVRLNTLK